jgi:hypothetical protein
VSTETFKTLGVKILPTDIAGVSPLKAEFTVVTSDRAEAYSIDFADGTHEAGMLIDEGDLRVAYITHEYKYRKAWSKYTSHHYYPVVTVYGYGVNGEQMQTTINTEQTGRSLTIEVRDPAKPQE